MKCKSNNEEFVPTQIEHDENEPMPRQDKMFSVVSNCDGASTEEMNAKQKLARLVLTALTFRKMAKQSA